MSENLKKAPTDEAAGAAWDEIMRKAEQFALIVQAYGGIATLATPEVQRSQEGLREKVLRSHRMEETAG